MSSRKYEQPVVSVDPLHNPELRPKHIDPQICRQVYHTYRANPTYWTPLRLSCTFKLKLETVEGILTLWCGLIFWIAVESLDFLFVCVLVADTSFAFLVRAFAMSLLIPLVRICQFYIPFLPAPFSSILSLAFTDLLTDLLALTQSPSSPPLLFSAPAGTSRTARSRAAKSRRSSPPSACASTAVRTTATLTASTTSSSPTWRTAAPSSATAPRRCSCRRRTWSASCGGARGRFGTLRADQTCLPARRFRRSVC